MESSASVWIFSDPACQWLPKVLDHIKEFNTSDKDSIIMLHCETAAGFDKSIPILNYFFNLYLTLNSLGDERTMFLNLKDMVSLIELYLSRNKKEKDPSLIDIAGEDITEFYNKYRESYEVKTESAEDESISAFKEFLKQNNCIDVNLLLDFYTNYSQSEINNLIKGHSYLIIGTPSSPIFKQFISILGKNVHCVSVETPLDISLHGSPGNQLSQKVTVVSELVEVKDVHINSENSSSFGSATEEYAEDIILSFLSLLLNSKNELALSKAMISPLINLSHGAFTALKHLSVEKEMPMCQVAVSYVTRIRLGGKGYAPSGDCPMLPHLKGLELFVDTLNQLQTTIEEDSCSKSAIKRLINVLKKRLLKSGSELLKISSVEAVAETLQSTLLSVLEILKSRVSGTGSQICQGTLDILYHFINFVSCNAFLSNTETILSQKKAKRTPLNVPPLLGYFRSPEEESSCDSKSTLNEDSVLSRSSVIQSGTYASYFHHSESSEVSASCVNSSTPSKVSFKNCLKENGESSQQKVKVSEIYADSFEVSALPKKSRKRCILSEITNECISKEDKNISVKDKNSVPTKNEQPKGIKVSRKDVKENAAASAGKKTKRSGKKFKPIQGQGTITGFFKMAGKN